MKSSLLAFPLVVFAPVLLGAACTSSTTGGAGAGDVLTCQADGDGCDVDDDCCNFSCSSGLCATTQTCVEDDQGPCSSGTDCCSGVCAGGGKCGLPAGVEPVTCTPDGDMCIGDADCCDFYCDTSSGTCIAATATCADDNDACAAPFDCCSNVCGSDGFCGE
jgi:hypothetical protein